MIRKLSLLLFCAALAGCAIFTDPLVRVYDELGLPFIGGALWISLNTLSADTELAEESIFVFGYPDESSVPGDPRVSATIEILAIFSDLPRTEGTNISNPENCLWIWHSGMPGSAGLVSFSEGSPVIDGEIQSGDAQLPFSEDRFASDHVSDVDGQKMATVYVVAYFRNQLGEITDASSYLALSAVVE